MEERAHDELVEVGLYRRLRLAEERALVVAAMNLPYWIFHEDDGWVLCVEPQHREAVADQLAHYERERRSWRPLRHARASANASGASVVLFGLLLFGFFLLQRAGGPGFVNRGSADAAVILEEHEYWRAVTALTLHADLSHIAGNVACGALFAWFVMPWLGTGLTWAAIFVAGTAGNLLNAWGYRGTAHSSIGASTAVFGALGILVGCQIAAVVTARPHLTWRQILIPLGAGLGLLALLGSGGDRTDFMAHFWGFAVGIAVGFVAILLRLKERLPALLQMGAGVAVLLAVVAAWMLAGRL